MIGESAVFRQALALAERAAVLPISILVQGETGTGKELFARHIHQASMRSGAYVAVNCAALPESLAESELFGYERGAFTGATSGKGGLWQEANQGTLFLDEVGELPLSIQAKLLRVLEDGLINRLGARRAEITDVRVIAATNRPLEEWVSSGRFRRDLYERLSRYALRLPPLRERGRDVLLLVHHLLATHPALTGYALTITTEAEQLMLSLSWPGNIRELERLLIRMRVEQVETLLPLHLLSPQATEAPAVSPEVSGLESRICAILAKHGPMSPSGLAEISKASPRSVHRTLVCLVSSGLVCPLGATRSRLYRLSA